MKIYTTLLIALLLLLGCQSTRLPAEEGPEYIQSNPEGRGPELVIEMTRGPGHNHPLMAIWAEDTSGQFLQTLYVAESIGRGIFRHGNSSEGFWQPGEIRRPAALPRWAHKRGILAADGLYMPTPREPVADAYSGPTPAASFVLQTRLDTPVAGPIRIFFEINQTWDWNEYWTNNKYPDNKEYKTSCQPALIYMAEIDPDRQKQGLEMKVIGRSHHAGADGEIYTDVHTLSTALEIVKKLTVSVKSNAGDPKEQPLL